MRFVLCLLVSLLTWTPLTAAQTADCDSHSGLPVPRFVSLRFDEVAGRSGPTPDHSVIWMYQREGLPVKVIAETPDWRQIQDPDGAEVWMHRRLLSGRRSVWALTETELLARPEDDAARVARIDPGAILRLERCGSGWCRLEAGGRRGWAIAAGFWGVYGSEAEPSGALEGTLDPCYRSIPDMADQEPAPSVPAPGR